MVEPARLEDAAAIADVHVESWRETYSGLLPQSVLEELDLGARERMWADIISTIGDVWVARRENTIAGFCSVGRFREDSDLVKGKITALYVLKAFQKQRLGKSLFDVGAESLNSSELLPFGAWVLAENPACGFYESRGGRIAGERIEKIGGRDFREVLFRFDHVPHSN